MSMTTALANRRSPRSVLMALAATHVAVDALAGSVAVVLPALRERFDLTGAELGALVATFAASALLAQPLGGHLADRLGARRVAAVGAVTASVLLAMLGAAPHMTTVYLLLVVGGFGAAAFHPAAATVARDVAPERAHAALSLFAAGGMAGLALGPVAALFLIDVFGAAAVAALMAPGVLLGSLLAILVPARPTVRADQRDLREPRGSLWPVLAAGTLSAVGVTSFTSGIPLWYAETTSATPWSVGWSLAGFQLAGAIGGVIAAAVATRISAAATALGALALAPLPLALSLSTAPGGAPHIVFATVGGALANAATPLLIAAAQQRSPGQVAAASGMVMGVANGLAGIGFAAVAALADSIGLRLALWSAFAVLIPAGVVAAVTLRAARPPAPVVALHSAVSCRCAPATAA